MYLRLLIISIICLRLNIFTLNAQDTLTPTFVEEYSFKLYEEKSWKELADFGNRALKQGIDYYYLRLRVGIAYYERKNYYAAEKHFKIALKQNSYDDITKEYLYYCYYFTGRSMEARMTASKFSIELCKKTGVNLQSPLDFLIFEGGTKKTDSTYYYDKVKKTSSNYYDPAAYVHAGISHFIRDRISLFHAVTFYNQSNFTGKITQMQYYLKANIPLKQNWNMLPAFHFININFSSEIVPPPPSMPGPPPVRQTSVSVSKGYIGSLLVQKSLGNFGLGLGYTYSNMFNKEQSIHNVLASWSPLGNSRFILGGNIYVHTIDYYSSCNVSYAPFIYIQPLNRLSVKITYLSNQNENIIEENGYVANNSPDLINQRGSVIINLFLNKHLSLYALYQREYKTELIQKFNYNYNVFVGGIKISP